MSQFNRWLISKCFIDEFYIDFTDSILIQIVEFKNFKQVRKGRKDQDDAND